MSHHTIEKIIILKNTTAFDITLNGRVIAALGEKDFSEVPIRKLFGSGIKALVTSGDIVINDGEIDLSAELASSWIFGRHVSNLHFEYADSNGISTTTSTTPQQKAQLTWTATDADYLVEWAAEVRVQNSNRKIGVRARADGVFDINEIFINPSIASNDWGPVGGFIKRTITAGVHTIEIDFRSSNAGALVGIRNARIKVTQAV